MEQMVTMIPMFAPDGSHCAIARVRSVNSFSEVDVRWSGQERPELDLFLLTSDGLHGVIDGKAPHHSGEILYGIAAMNAQGVCVCCGPVRSNEEEFEAAMVRLRLCFGNTLEGSPGAKAAPPGPMPKLEVTPEATGARLNASTPKAQAVLETQPVPNVPAAARPAQPRQQNEELHMPGRAQQNTVAAQNKTPEQHIAKRADEGTADVQPKPGFREKPKDAFPIGELFDEHILQKHYSEQKPLSEREMPKKPIAQEEAEPEHKPETPPRGQIFNMHPLPPPNQQEVPSFEVRAYAFKAQEEQQQGTSCPLGSPGMMEQPAFPFLPPVIEFEQTGTPGQQGIGAQPAPTPASTPTPPPAPIPEQQPQPIPQPLPAQQHAPIPQPLPEQQPAPVPQPLPTPPPVPFQTPIPMLPPVPFHTPIPMPPPIPMRTRVPVSQPTPTQPPASTPAPMPLEQSAAKPFASMEQPKTQPQAQPQGVNEANNNKAQQSGFPNSVQQAPLQQPKRRENNIGDSNNQNSQQGNREGSLPECLRLAKEASILELERLKNEAQNKMEQPMEENPAQAPTAQMRSEEIASNSSTALKRILEEAKRLFPNNEAEAEQTLNSPLRGAASAWAKEADALVSDNFQEESLPVYNRSRRNLPSRIANPFPSQFPGSVWIRVERPEGQGPYLEGFMRIGGDTFSITAVPGEFKPVPPRHLQGFHRYIPTRSGGYWVRVRKN